MQQQQQAVMTCFWLLSCLLNSEVYIRQHFLEAYTDESRYFITCGIANVVNVQTSNRVVFSQ